MHTLIPILTWFVILPRPCVCISPAIILIGSVFGFGFIDDTTSMQSSKTRWRHNIDTLSTLITLFAATRRLILRSGGAVIQSFNGWFVVNVNMLEISVEWPVKWYVFTLLWRHYDARVAHHDPVRLVQWRVTVFTHIEVDNYLTLAWRHWNIFRITGP